jgi:hypothetical protein
MPAGSEYSPAAASEKFISEEARVLLPKVIHV